MKFFQRACAMNASACCILVYFVLLCFTCSYDSLSHDSNVSSLFHGKSNVSSTL